MDRFDIAFTYQINKYVQESIWTAKDNYSLNVYLGNSYRHILKNERTNLGSLFLLHITKVLL